MQVTDLYLMQLKDFGDTQEQKAGEGVEPIRVEPFLLYEERLLRSLSPFANSEYFQIVVLASSEDF